MIKARIVIEVREDGQVYVTGPLDKKQLCFAMLEEAKETVHKWKNRSITIPTIMDLKKMR